MNLNQKLARIDKEIQQGLKMKAADRLRNLTNQYPNELIIWERLAELYYNSGFLDAAGKFWILSEPKSEVIQKCVTLYEKSVNYSGTQILNEIIFKGDKNKLSDYAKNRLLALEKSSKEKSGYVPNFLPKLNKTQRKNQAYTSSTLEKLIPFVLLFALISTLVLAVVGLGTVIDWIF